MKKFTLLAVAAMFASTAFAQTELNGIKLSEGSNFEDYHFYRIRNMRAMRLDYTNGVLKNMKGDSVNTDRGGYYMSETLPDGTPTPKIADHPYMGLSNMAGNWWLSFANDNEIKDANTEFWYFTGDKKFPGQLKIQNAVIKGSVSTVSKHAYDLVGNNRANMDFNTKNNFYYVLPVDEAFAVMDTKDENVSWTDSILQHLTAEDFAMAFAFSLKDTISDQNDYRNQCLDMNNYINVKKRIPQIDENGDTVTNAQGNPIYYRYGFAGVDRTWSPVTTTSNKNHWENNGSIFFVEPAATADAIAAKEAYEKIIADGFRDGAIENAKYCFANTVNTIAGWRNLPALFSESAMTKLKSIQDWCDKWDGEGVDLNAVKDTETRDAYVAAVDKMAKDKLNEAATLIGTGCVVKFQNQLALRDLDKFVNDGESIPEEYQLGNAYLAAGGDPTYKYGNAIFHMNDDDAFADVAGTGVEPRLEADKECEWELIPVSHIVDDQETVAFLLYNPENECYIRKYHDLFDHAGGEDSFCVDANLVSEISWMTTTDKEDAAPFLFYGCANEEGQAMPTDDELELMVAADLDTDIENKARLQSKYSVAEKNPVTGKWETTTYEFNIHRGSLGSEYKFINWRNTSNNWFADTNAFLIESVEMGGINEVAAEKAVKSTGIYDLQGRRVNKAEKGVYIVNGVKTFVR